MTRPGVFYLQEELEFHLWRSSSHTEKQPEGSKPAKALDDSYIQESFEGENMCVDSGDSGGLQVSDLMVPEWHKSVQDKLSKHLRRSMFVFD